MSYKNLGAVVIFLILVKSIFTMSQGRTLEQLVKEFNLGAKKAQTPEVLKNQGNLEKQILTKVSTLYPGSQVVWVHRHGESFIAKLAGQRRNAPLDNKPKEFKENFGKYSKTYMSAMGENIFSSPIKRSQETASLFKTGSYSKFLNNVKTLAVGYEKQQYTSSRTKDDIGDHRVECKGKVCQLVKKKVVIMIPKESEQSVFLRSVLVVDEVAKRSKPGKMSVAFLHGGVLNKFLRFAFNQVEKEIAYSQGFPIVVDTKAKTMRALGLTRKVDKKTAVVSYHLLDSRSMPLFRYEIDKSLEQSYETLRKKYKGKYPNLK